MRVALIFPFLLAGCASTRVFELPRVQSQLSQTLQTTEGIVGRAQTDFQEKKLLVDNLAKGGGNAYRENESDLNARIKRMDKALSEITASRKEMVDANSDLASLAYNKTSIHSGEREYPLVNEAVSRFEKAAERTNSSLLNYSRESNSLADVVSQKKLFYNFDVGDFQKRVQKSIHVTQENQKTMTRELARAESVMNNWTKPEGKEAQEEIFNEMHATAKAYSARAGDLSTLSKSMHAATFGNARVSTLDKEWPAAQKIVSEYDLAVSELTTLNDKFQRQTESFRNPLKRAR